MRAYPFLLTATRKINSVLTIGKNKLPYKDPPVFACKTILNIRSVILYVCK